MTAECARPVDAPVGWLVRRSAADLIRTFERHLQDCGRTEATIESYVGILTRIDAQIPVGLAGASTQDLRDWINTGNRGPASRHVCGAALRAFFAWATDPDEPRLEYDPSRRLARVKVPDRAARPIRDDQLAVILEGAQPPYRLFFLLAAFAGLRCIEIARLHREDVNAEQVWVQGKGGKSRLVPTHPLVWAAVKDLPPGPLAVDAHGAHLDRQAVSHRGNHHLLRLFGGRDVSMHRLRHWFATATYAASGEDIRAVQELLGHASVAMTQRYIQVGAGRKAAAVAALPVPSSTAAGAS